MSAHAMTQINLNNYNMILMKELGKNFGQNDKT